jgi:hypothetical protein
MTTHIELGHALITMVEPYKESVVAYNRWYEHDHSLSGVMTGPGAFSYRRFVATRELKQRRFPEDSPIAQPIGDGSFIALYWFEKDQLDSHCEWAYPEVGRLAAAGRMNPDRRHVSTDYYDLLGVVSRDASPVPVELALNHPYPALVMVWTEATSEWPDAGTEDFLRRLVQTGSPIAQVVTFRPHPLPSDFAPTPGAIVGDDDKREVLAHCAFLDIELALSAASTVVHDALETVPTVTPLLVAPFVPTIPGTDAYLDELW